MAPDVSLVVTPVVVVASLIDEAVVDSAVVPALALVAVVVLVVVIPEVDSESSLPWLAVESSVSTKHAAERSAPTRPATRGDTG